MAARTLPSSSVERGKLVGRGLDAIVLGAQVGDVGDEPHPVEIIPAAIFGQAGKRVQLRGNILVASAQLADHGGHGRQSSLQRGGVGDEGVDLCFVGPTEHVLAAVTDAPSIVFFVPFPVLDLTGPGHGLLRQAELLHAVDAGVVGSPAELRLQPQRKSGVRFEIEHVDQERVGGPALGRACRRQAGRDPEVDDPGAEVIGIDPRCDGRVVPVRDEQRQGEVVQHPLRRPLPLGCVRSDLDELPGEREVALRQRQLGAEPLAQLEAGAG